MLPFRIINITALFFHIKTGFLDLVQEFFTGAAVKILYHSVVVEDLQIVVREDNGHEKVEFFITGVVRMFFSSLETYFAGGSASVVSVCDIKCRDLIEQTGQTLDEFRIIYYPQRVLYTVVRSNVIFRFMVCHITFHNSPDPLVVPVSQEDRFRICIAHIKVIDPVFFFFYTGKFMLFDRVVLIFVYCHTSDDPGLYTAIHDLTVNVKSRFIFLHKHAACKTFCDVVSCFFIHRLIIRIFLFRQIDFCSANVKKTVRIVRSHFCRFLTVHNIIWKRNNFVRILCIRPDRLKRFYCSHFT